MNEHRQTVTRPNSSSIWGPGDWLTGSPARNGPDFTPRSRMPQTSPLEAVGTRMYRVVAGDSHSCRLAGSIAQLRRMSPEGRNGSRSNSIGDSRRRRRGVSHPWSQACASNARLSWQRSSRVFRGRLPVTSKLLFLQLCSWKSSTAVPNPRENRTHATVSTRVSVMDAFYFRFE